MSTLRVSTAILLGILTASAANAQLAFEAFEGAFPGSHWFVGDEDSGSSLDPNSAEGQTLVEKAQPIPETLAPGVPGERREAFMKQFEAWRHLTVPVPRVGEAGS